MISSTEKHLRRTRRLARALKRPDVYNWIVTKGFFPESYVLPPCFEVTAHPKYGKTFSARKGKKFYPKLSEYLQVHFPKTNLTDRTFGIIDPELHSDIAYLLASNWKAILGVLFHKDNKVFSYSFPIPLNAKARGKIGQLRSGRMIYEFIEMAEHDLASVAYRYNYIVTTDIKNFYPSIYTHSIPWAIHGKGRIRKGGNRYDYGYFGNKLDKLFQNANDGCTNGIPIGPVVSDLISEIVLAGVDRQFSRNYGGEAFVVRFKDDYRILARTEEEGRSAIKQLQAALKEYRLELNDEKTQCRQLPNGLFRNWVSQYHFANPNPKAYYPFKRFKEVYLAVVTIDRDNPGCGIIDRFLADVVTRKYRLRVKLNPRTLPKITSLLLTLGRLRTKAFPKVLAIIESILKSPFGSDYTEEIEAHLLELLQQLSTENRESENRYLIAWIIYFLRANRLDSGLKSPCKYQDPVVRSIWTSRFTPFASSKDFKVFSGVRAASRKKSMLRHLDLFKPQ